MTASATAGVRSPHLRSELHPHAAFIAILIAVGVVAFLIRLSIMVRGGGLSGLGAYDDGVYYAAADALLHGRVPYRDFLFIQPPLISVVTAPFATIGALTTDPLGFKIARIAFMAVGGVNAALCAAVVRRFGWTAVIAAGFGYAVFHPAVYAERSVLLEPLGTCGILLAILSLQLVPVSRRFAVIAGVFGGLACGAKIWYLVPALLLVLLARQSRLRYLVGVAIGGCAIYLPFLFASPGRMVQEVILDQIGRGGGENVPTPLQRIPMILGDHSTLGMSADHIGLVLAIVATSAVIVTLLTPGARPFAVLAVATVAILLAAPSWFAHYTALTAPPLALCLGVGAGRLTGLVRARPMKAAIAALTVLGVLAVNAAGDMTPYGVRVPRGLTEAARIVPGCITADDPGTLIAMNVLSRDLRDSHCAVWPDVTGWTYDPRDLARAEDGSLLDRRLNVRWQHDLVAFLESGDATIRTRSATGYSAASKLRIDSGAVLFRRGRFVIHATEPR